MKLTVWLNRVVKRDDLSRRSTLLASAAIIMMASSAGAQTINLNLEQAQELARANYPLIRQKGLLALTTELNIANLSKGYLPQFAVYGQASYQSDVTQVDLQGAPIKIEAPAKDQYKMYAEATQLIYDGGQINAQKKIQEQTRMAEDHQVEVELYKVRQRINSIFLGILFFDAQLQQAALIRNDISIGIKRTEAQVKNGVAFRSNLHLLQAELLKNDQRRIELEGSRLGLINSLAVFIGRPLTDATKFIVPDNLSIDFPSGPASSFNATSPPLRNSDVTSPPVTNSDATSPPASNSNVTSPTTANSNAISPPVRNSHITSPPVGNSGVTSSGVTNSDVASKSAISSNVALKPAITPVNRGPSSDLKYQTNLNYQSITYRDISRPEILQFAARSKLLGLQESLINARNRPKTSLFLQGGYGRPALNMLESQFEWYYIGGLRLSWNLGGMYTARKERQLIQISQSSLRLQEESFVLNTRAEMASQLAEITKLGQLVATDNEIINLRNQVRDAAKAQLDNGVITASDYLREINSADQAAQTKITHEIQLLQAKMNYRSTSGQ